MESFDVTDSIKKWVSIDNRIKEQNSIVKALREERDSVRTSLDNYFQNENQNNVTIQITDGKLRYCETKQTSPLTLKYVEECLNDVLQNETVVQQCMQHIKTNRSVKVVRDIKRTYTKTDE